MFKNSYSQKIMASFIVVNLFGVFISGFVSYNMNKKVLFEKYSLIVNDYTNQMAFYTSKQVETVQRIAESFIFDYQFHSLIGQKYDAYESYNVLNKHILPKGSNALKSFGNAMNAQLYLHNQTINEHYTIGSDDFSETRSSFSVMHIDRLGADQIVEGLRKKDKYITWIQTEENKRRGTISFYARLINFNTMREDGVLILEFRVSDLFMNSNSNSSPRIFFKITGDEFEVRKEPFDVDNTDNCIIIEKDIGVKGFKLYSYTRKSDFYPQMWENTAQLLLVSFFSFLVMLLLGFFFKKFLYEVFI